MTDRRTFLKTISLSAAALSGGALAFRATRDPKPRDLKNWLWLTNDNATRSPDDWKRIFAALRQSGVRAILPEVYDARNAYYASQRLPVKTDWLGTILPLARAADLEVHAWMWAMPCLLPEIIEEHPDWYNVNAQGESAVNKPVYVDYYKFLDPGRPEVREWVQGTLKELASIPELKGIHLDYIRHPDAILPRGLWKKYNIVQDKVYPPYDYGYTEYERTQFRKKCGVDPLKIKDAEHQAQWMKFRLDMVVDLVNDYLVPAAHAKQKMITAAVFPGPTLAREMVRQDWGRFQLDAFLPMLYNAFYEEGPEWVRQETQEGVAAVEKPIYSGIFVGGMDEAAFSQTVNMAIAGGASGVAIFSLGAMDDAKWQALRRITAQASAR